MPVMKKGRWLPELDETELKKTDSFSAPVTAEPDRYHLYLSSACSFCARPLMVSNLIGLSEYLSLSQLCPVIDNRGWTFDIEHRDPINNCATLGALYLKAKPDYTGKVTLPVLWDKQTQTIASNDSDFIAKELSLKFVGHGNMPINLLVEQEKTEQLCQWVDNHINKGVYKTAAATTQETYSKACISLFNALEQVEERLQDQRYMLGERLSLADVYLFSTLIRFDLVYFHLFKASIKPISAFPNLTNYVCSLMQVPAIAESVDIQSITTHYYKSYTRLNPDAIIPELPEHYWPLTPPIGN